MFSVTLQVIICLIIAFVSFIFGCFVCDASRKKTKETKKEHTPQYHTPNNTKETKKEVTGEKLNLLSAPRGGVKDNLQLIKGVGAKIEEKLNALGIYHFDQMAGLTKDEIIWIDEQLSFPGRVERDNWIEQAKILASGESTEFSKRVEKGEVSTSKPSK